MGLEILVFTQATAGKQLVTGLIGAKETLAASCVRSLRQASGLKGKAKRYIGKELMAAVDATYGFYLMETDPILDECWQIAEGGDDGELHGFNPSTGCEYWLRVLAASPGGGEDVKMRCRTNCPCCSCAIQDL
jgi:hypothetical protein